MAALAVPALEALADAALVALRAIGIGGGSVLIGEAVKKKVEEAENAKASPIAKTDAGTQKAAPSLFMSAERDYLKPRPDSLDVSRMPCWCGAFFD